MNYADFIASKAQADSYGGFEHVWMPDFLFDFQRHLTDWAIRKGRAAIFADTGLGKTPMQLVWAQNVVMKTNRPVLILTPLAVGPQTVREGEKFGVAVQQSKTGHDGTPEIIVTNYERLHYFDREMFGGVVCDESGILKNYAGATRAAITEFMSAIRYRLLCTATAAPNDHAEIGTQAEALGVMRRVEMLGMFFIHDSAHTQSWRLKGHGCEPFWRWVASWARAIRKPSDLGFNDDRFDLPPLVERETLVRHVGGTPGYLFAMPAIGLKEQRADLRRTLRERCETVAKIVSHGKQAVCWCHLNAEGDTLASMIDGAEQVSGADDDDTKIAKYERFTGGKTRVLVIKPRIGAFGLNWQHCNHMTFFPSHSFEQYYQGIRRCWRFGQKFQVVADIITTEGQADVLANLQEKAKQADYLYARMVANMNEAIITHAPRDATLKVKVPKWLR